MWQAGSADAGQPGFPDATAAAILGLAAALGARGAAGHSSAAGGRGCGGGSPRTAPRSASPSCRSSIRRVGFAPPSGVCIVNFGTCATALLGSGDAQLFRRKRGSNVGCADAGRFLAALHDRLQRLALPGQWSAFDRMLLSRPGKAAEFNLNPARLFQPAAPFLACRHPSWRRGLASTPSDNARFRRRGWRCAERGGFSIGVRGLGLVRGDGGRFGRGEWRLRPRCPGLARLRQWRGSALPLGRCYGLSTDGC